MVGLSVFIKGHMLTDYSYCILLIYHTNIINSYHIIIYYIIVIISSIQIYQILLFTYFPLWFYTLDIPYKIIILTISKIVEYLFNTFNKLQKFLSIFWLCRTLSYDVTKLNLMPTIYFKNLEINTPDACIGESTLLKLLHTWLV